MSDKTYATYILASRRHGTLYVGITSDLPGRLHKHRSGAFGGFTSDYEVHYLVWFEVHTSVEAAIAREKRLKNWKREWKINLIEATNPNWDDLALDIGFEPIRRVAELP